MSKTIEEILTPKPEAHPRIYAYTIADAAHKGLFKLGQCKDHGFDRTGKHCIE